MSLELVRESIKVSQVIGQDAAQTIVENDIIVPDVKPDVADILVLDGDVAVNSMDVMQDKILIGGTIRYKILYVSDDADEPVKGINTAVNFSCGVDVANARHGMRCRAKCDIEHIDYEILNGRKINVKTILSVSGKVTEEVEHEIANGLKGLDDIQVLKDNVNVNYYLGDNEVSYTAKEALQVPAGKPTIAEILRNDVKITGKDYKIVDDKVIARGELSIATLYIGDDEERSIQYMEHEVPFAQAVELEDLGENAVCQVEFRVIDSQFEAGEDSDGELRVLNSEVALGVYASAFEKRNIEIIADAYSPHTKVNIEKSQVGMEEFIAENKGQVTVKDSVVVQEGNPEIGQVFNVISTPVLSECKVQDDKVLVEGLVNNKIIYLATNSKQPIFCSQQETPFRQSVDMKGITAEMPCDVSLDVEHCNYSMISASEVEIRVVVGVNAKVMSQSVIPVISKATESPLDDKRVASAPSITIYFAQPEDTLWRVAKKYYTTVSDLVRVNDLSERDAIIPGQQIIIPRRA